MDWHSSRHGTCGSSARREIKYHVFGTFISRNFSQFSSTGGIGGCNVIRYWRTLDPIVAPIGQLTVDTINNWTIIDGNNQKKLISAVGNWDFYFNRFLGNIGRQRGIFNISSGCANTSGAYGNNLQISDIVRADGMTEITECEFIVKESFADGTEIIRHQETRESCPEVEQFNCELDKEQVINLELNRLEVLFITVNDNSGINFLTLTDEVEDLLGSNPENCLIVWKIKRSFGLFFSVEEITQICSFPSCPPPLFEHDCLSCCRDCPEGTCAVECGDHICCYGDDGIAVEEIPLEEYCNNE